ATSVPVVAIANGTTKVPDIRMPGKLTNRVPVILGPPKFQMDENQVTTLTLIVSDPDINQTLKASLDGPAFASLLGPTPIGSTSNVPVGPTLRYALRLAPGFSDAGNYTIRITVADEFGGRTTFEIALTVRNVNRLPVATSQSVSLDEDVPSQINLAATDLDGDQLLFKVVNNPLHGTLSGTGKTITYSPEGNYFGTDLFTYKVSDGTADSNTATVSLTIRPVNDAPLITAPSEQSVREGQTLSFVVVGADVDAGQSLTIAGVDLPAGAKLDAETPTSARFTWTPGFTQAAGLTGGRYTFAFKVTDSGVPPLSVSKQIVVNVFDTRHDLALEGSDLTVLGADSLSGTADATGTSVATGDVNGDDVADLIIGAPFAKGLGNDHGRVYIFFGRQGLHGDIDLASREADVTIIGEADGDGFGASVVTGDVNGDGKPDLVVGAPRAGSKERGHAGSVYVVLGTIAPGTFKIDEKANLVLRGARASDELGASIAVGRLRQDSGAADLIIAAPKSEVQTPGGTMIDAGVVYVFFGGNALVGSKDLLTTQADLTLTGAVAGGELGSALATGDYNGDKLGDLAIGAPLADVTFKDQGIAYLVLGSAGLKGAASISQVSAFQFNGRDVGDTFGHAVAFGDLNGDGRQDLIVGAPGGDGPINLRPAAGEVSVFFGTNSLETRPPGMVIYGAG
ncbi:MAG: Ig-like domain-containing protein, partial [Acidobacteriota bacterium]